MRDTVDSERPRMRAISLLERPSRSAARNVALVTSAPSARGSGWMAGALAVTVMCKKYIAKFLGKFKAAASPDLSVFARGRRGMGDRDVRRPRTTRRAS